MNVNIHHLTKFFSLFLLTNLMTGITLSPKAQSRENESFLQNEIEKNWPRFRGLGGLGISDYTNIPTFWDESTSEGILWKKDIPLPGENSPILWGDHVFITGANKEKREVYCFDANSGDLLWRKSVDNISNESDYRQLGVTSVLTASTSATDGDRIYSIFANGDIFCLDFDGNLIWSKCIGPIKNSFGHASSLLIHQDLLIIQLDQAFEDDELSKVMAINTQNGDVTWTTKRNVPISWSSPIVIDTGNQHELITCANPWVIAYDPSTGNELWRVNCLGGEVALSPVYSDGIVFVANAMAACVAIRPGGQGDVTNTHVKWAIGDIYADICSPLAAGEFLYILESGGYLLCYNTQTGETIWEHDLDNNFTASPSLANNQVYLLSEDGVMTIIENSRVYKEIATCKIDDKTKATPAFSNSKIYIRGENYLYCVENKD